MYADKKKEKKGTSKLGGGRSAYRGKREYMTSGPDLGCESKKERKNSQGWGMGIR